VKGRKGKDKKIERTRDGKIFGEIQTPPTFL
jgi:hypothetical protein